VKYSHEWDLPEGRLHQKEKKAVRWIAFVSVRRS
jgi:hypothetical protein